MDLNDFLKAKIKRIKNHIKKLEKELVWYESEKLNCIAEKTRAEINKNNQILQDTIKALNK